MAIKKSTLKFIQIPSDFFQQRDTRKLMRLFDKKYPGHGVMAPLVVLALYMYFAQNRAGYYAFNDEDLLDDLSNDLGIDSEVIQDAISLSASIGIIDETLFKINILTSYDYQLMYQKVMKKLRRDFSFVGKPNVVIETDESQDPPKVKIDSSEETTDSSEETTDSSEETTDSSEESVDFSGICPRNVKYSIVEYSTVGDNARARATPLVFDFLPLNNEWQKLLQQPLWSMKTPEALEIAYTTLRGYPSFVAIEVIRHTILAGIRDLDPPTKEMYEVAKIAADKYKTNKRSKIEKLDNPGCAFGYFSSPDEHLPAIVNDIRNRLSAIKRRVPDAIEDMFVRMTLTLSGDNLTIQVADEVSAWLNEQDLSQLYGLGLKITILKYEM